jgi:hypothetical protein
MKSLKMESDGGLYWTFYWQLGLCWMLIWESISLSNITLFFEFHNKCYISSKMTPFDWVSDWVTRLSIVTKMTWKKLVMLITVANTVSGILVDGIMTLFASSFWYVTLAFGLWVKSHGNVRHITNQFLVVAVCAVPRICVCVCVCVCVCQQVSTVARHIWEITPAIVDRGSVVGIASCYGLGGSGIDFGWGGGGRFSAPIQTGPKAHPTICTMGFGSFPGVKRSKVSLTTRPI